MILGHAIIAVPTGIVSAELVQASRHPESQTTRACPSCGLDGHDPDAVHCKHCGDEL
jgi:voltage-gated potassium channel